ncbi:MAG: DNA translocase FtsK [Clostridia bacterium]|nr:DNA translocase FtsK [Clostridia bacterium]
MTYTTPGGSYSRLYADMAQQKHLLIAGATGSGKSTALDGILHAILHGSPADDRLILIDLKKVELIDYHQLPHLHSYADDVPSALQALQTAIDIMLARYTDMQRRRIKEYDGSHLYVIIDELADLMTTAPKQAAPLIQRITQLGRGAACHMIAATQCPISAVIPTPIKVNFPAKLGLMTATAQDSRNIIARAGCEKLPYPPDAGEAYGYYLRGPKLDLYQLPRIPDAERHRIIDHWTRQSA